MAAKMDTGLLVENESGKSVRIDKDALAELFKLLRKDIECVVLNACYSEEQATALQEHIPYVVGMRRGNWR